MPLYHSYNEVQRILKEAIANPKTRQFVAGYIEGHGERSGNNWKISPKRFEEALRQLSGGHESLSGSLEITARDVEKIREHASSASPMLGLSMAASNKKGPPIKVVSSSLPKFPQQFRKAA